MNPEKIRPKRKHSPRQAKGGMCRAGGARISLSNSVTEPFADALRIQEASGSHHASAEENHHDEAQRNAVGGEPCEGVVGHEFEQPRNGHVAENKGDHGPDEELAAGGGLAGLRSESVGKRKEPGGEDCGDGQEETESGGHFAVETAEQAAGDRAAGTGHSGDERQALPQAHDDGIFHGEFFVTSSFLAEALGEDEDEGEQDEYCRGDPEVAEILADQVFEQHPCDTDGDGADDDHPPHPVVKSALGGVEKPCEPPGEDLPNLFGEEDQYSQLRSQLDHGGEAGTGIFAPEQLGDDPQVAGG